MNYIDINFNEVKGYTKLTEAQQKLFREIYRLHNSCQGTDYKADWTPTSVKAMKTYLKVTFKNGVWLHYLPDMTWF